MTKKALVRSVAAGLALLVLPAPSTGGDTLFTEFQDPPSRFRPFVRWWWNGGCVTEIEVLRQLDLMRDAGIGGVEINTIAMPERTAPETLEGVAVSSGSARSGPGSSGRPPRVRASEG